MIHLLSGLYVYFLLLSAPLIEGNLHGHTPDSNPFVTRIPFTYHDGFIIADVTMARVFPLRFIIDTGSEHTLLLKREYTDILRLPASRKVTLLGADLKTEITARVYPQLSLQLGDGMTQFQDIIVTDEYILPLEEMLGVRIDGILGASFFQNRTLEIDYRKKVLKITSGVYSPKYTQKWMSVPLRIYKNKPYITADIPALFRDSKGKNLLLDTGASLSLVLQYVQDVQDSITSGMIKSYWGKGLGGEIEGFGGETDILISDEQMFRSVFVCLQELDSVQWSFSEKDGLIGNKLLEQFGRVCFDFQEQVFYYRPLKQRLKRKKTDQSDIIIYAYGSGLRQYYIHAVTEKSEPWIAGLRPGDIILRLGNFPVSWYSLSAVMKKINHFTSDELKVKVNQAGNIRDIKIRKSL